ncbi:YraN family protein [Sneathiella aquimaris]|uniref:YraN family protein n=1 Tax=Sneathiella aquimaris TaxID=2599305 RepID=UPI00146DEFD5|nr:YraN family protein [Sneathiella aquimaris]
MTKVSKNKLKRRRQLAVLKGAIAESLAVFYLRLKGYRILARRFKRPVGEIDIIACKGKTLVAAEVKSRATVEEALHSIHTKQRRRISRAMEAFIAGHPDMDRLDIRFDVLLVTSFVKFPVHLENAW